MKRNSVPKILGLTQSGSKPPAPAPVPSAPARVPSPAELERTAKQIIDSLIGQGKTKAQIARAVGRDSSLIGQIQRGNKPAVNLIPSLEQLDRGEEVTPPSRRKTKGGAAAKVRKGKGSPAKARLLKDKGGRIRNAPPTSREWVFERRLEKIGLAGGKVSFRVTFQEGTTKLIFKSGIWAQQALREIGKFGGAFAWLSEQAAANQGYGQDDYGDVDSVEILAFYQS